MPTTGAASIQGMIFEDNALSGSFNIDDNVIANVCVVLKTPGETTLRTTLSNSGGIYTFDNITTAGTYTLYETVSAPVNTTTLPTTFSQPNGYNFSTTHPTLFVDITQDDIDYSYVLSSNYDFGHLSLTPFNCSMYGYQVSGEGNSSFATIDLKTGVESDSETLSPAGQYNAIGYNVQNGYIFGYCQSATQFCCISNYAKVALLAAVPHFPTSNSSGDSYLYNVGDVNMDGYLYIYYGYIDNVYPTNLFFVINVNYNSPNYLYLVDPSNAYAIQTSSYGVAIDYLNIRDWGFNPSDNDLYAVGSSASLTKDDTAPVYEINPITGAVTTLAATSFAEGLPAMSIYPSTGDYNTAFYGAVFFADAGDLYAINNTTGVIYKVVLDPSAKTYTASEFSKAAASTNNDGARCAYSPINANNPPLKITKDTNRYATLTGNVITYTLIVYNPSSYTHADASITDAIPSGTTFVDGSVTINGATATKDAVTVSDRKSVV